MPLRPTSAAPSHSDGQVGPPGCGTVRRDLGSDPVEAVLHCAGAKPVAGNFYVLCVGVSQYQHADGPGFKNHQSPAADA